MLRFVSVAERLVKQSTRKFVVSRDAIFSDLEAALSASKTNRILVYDAALIPGERSDSLKLNIMEARNGVPYRPPFSVTAAGGYVVRSATEGIQQPLEGLDRVVTGDVLLIFRRGVWDLPKGKLDRNESIEQAALREVGEEVGAHDLHIVSALGATVHGYPVGPRYAVKTTHWFLMETSSIRFMPQASEQIEDVRWVPWQRAREMVGYDTIRAHMAAIDVRRSTFDVKTLRR